MTADGVVRCCGVVVRAAVGDALGETDDVGVGSGLIFRPGILVAGEEVIDALAEGDAVIGGSGCNLLCGVGLGVAESCGL